MKKIINIFVIVILLFSFCLSSAFALNKSNKTKRYHGGSPDVFNFSYDLDTFKYNKRKNRASIDLIYNFDFYPKLYYVKSPYDNNLITHLIFKTTYSFDNNKLDIEYKGFLSSRRDDKNRYAFNDIKIYHDNNKEFFPDFDVYMEDLKIHSAFEDEEEYRNIKESIKYFYNAYKNDKLFELEYIRSALNGLS